MELRDENGGLLAFNDDWATNLDRFDPAGRELAPAFATESALRVSLPPGHYTAIVRGKGETEGTALVEFYDLRR
ncbi:MAG TPA: hypothetical protein VK474_04090 [Chthoniobacterales bacterium]|nr:hypothetical protein [Chthoniobacterales bacterium]